MFPADNIALEKTVTSAIFMCQSAAFAKLLTQSSAGQKLGGVKGCTHRLKGTATASILRVRSVVS